MRHTAAPFAAALSLLALAACAPGAPAGVDKANLDDAVSRAVGDPNTCLMIAEVPSGKVVYRYNSATTCDRALPACEVAGERKVKDVLALTVKDQDSRTLSCNSLADGSRGASWAAGPIPGKKLVYAAAMEGDRVFPGRMMADRLSRAWTKAGLTPASP